jgi:hypothetical protein
MSLLIILQNLDKIKIVTNTITIAQISSGKRIKNTKILLNGTENNKE